MEKSLNHNNIILTTGTSQIPNYTISTTVSTIADYGLTPEEEKELQSLTEEKNRWLKEQQLKYFQNMPAHLRQDILDHSLIRDLVNGMTNIDESKFHSIDRLNELNYRNNHILFKADMDINYDSNYYSKYLFILNIFSTEELAEAHANATAEESLSDTTQP